MIDLNIEHLTENDHRVWNQREWFEQTTDFICSQIKAVIDLPNGVCESSCSLYERLLDCDDVKELQAVNALIHAGEYAFAENLIDKITHFLSETEVSSASTLLNGWQYFFLAKIQLERLEYRHSNEYFLKGIKELNAHLRDCEKLEYYLEWSLIFIETKDYDLADRVLTSLSTHITPKSYKLYSRLLYSLFLINKKNYRIEAAISYANLALTCNDNTLDNTEMYHLHLFAAEYYSSLNRNFNESIQHFAMANTHLSNKWKDYITLIKSLQGKLPEESYREIKATADDKVRKLLLETKLHSNYYTNTLKNAYLELAEVHRQLQEYSLTDSLTGLHNRRYLWEKAKEFFTLAKKEDVPISCCMIDFDDFKYINDRYGHIAGDKVLQISCEVIKNFFRKSDIVIRFGGEEILVLLYNTNLETAQKLTVKLCNMIKNLNIELSSTENVKVSVSIGISSCEHTQDSEMILLNEMIIEADKLMYLEKSKKKCGMICNRDGQMIRCKYLSHDWDETPLTTSTDSNLKKES